jgi:hypothetical protein
MLHTMGFNEVVEKVIVIIGGPEPLANAILRLVSQLDLTGLAIIFELGGMLRNMVGRCPTVFGEQEMQAIPRVPDAPGAGPRAGKGKNGKTLRIWFWPIYNG